jgi:DNA polymerase-3 subunit epsilon
VTNAVVLDFETANERRGSPCVLGNAQLNGLEITGRSSLLIRPPEFRFEGFNVSLHGITAEMCEDQGIRAEFRRERERRVGFGWRAT